MESLPAMTDFMIGENQGASLHGTSLIQGVEMLAGNTYYLIVDGYGGYCEGDYIIDFEFIDSNYSL